MPKWILFCREIIPLGPGTLRPCLQFSCGLSRPIRNRIIGLCIVNKLRGDPRLFEDGVKILQIMLSGVPTLGVASHYQKIWLPEAA